MDSISSHTVKKSLLYVAITGTAVFAICVPLAAKAGLFDFAAALFEVAEAAQPAYNSQTMPLLSPAKNIDPNPNVGGGDIAVIGGEALLPQEGPSGTVADIAARPEATQISVHVVRDGDTLSQIADLYNVKINTIIWANDIKGRYIQPGQELIILPINSVRHTVAKGETLASIVKKYQGDVEETASYNEIAADATLTAGDIVLIPDGIIAPPPAPARKAGSSGTATLRGGGGPQIGGYYSWPVNGGVVTQGIHGYNGIDIGAPYGTNAYAAAAGTVLVARGSGWNGGYGLYVVVQHDNGTQTLYAHLSAVSTSAGATVGAGTTIGKIGSTGKSTGNHLHFEVRGAANPFR